MDDESNVPVYSFSDLKKMVAYQTELEKENVALKMEIVALKNKIVEARIFAELDSKYSHRLKKLFTKEKK